MEYGEDERIFREWLDKHANVVWKIVRTFAVSSHDRDDLFQDTLVNLWSSVRRFRQESSSTTWV